jgi:hypothetical protein
MINLYVFQQTKRKMTSAKEYLLLFCVSYRKPQEDEEQNKKKLDTWFEMSKYSSQIDRIRVPRRHKFAFTAIAYTIKTNFLSELPEISKKIRIAFG